MEKRKIRQAIALEYDPNDDSAPKVIASGQGLVADKIIEKAKENKVPVHKDSKLADTLSRLEIGQEIPPELYEVVAEVLVFVDAMDKIRAKQKSIIQEFIINTRGKGTEYEEIAITFLKDHYAKILDTNYRCKFGEIDIVVKDKDFIAFVEVKFRDTDKQGDASEAVDYKKMRTISRVSDYYRMEKRISEYLPIRFDVIAINSNGIRWIKNAFEYIPN